MVIMKCENCGHELFEQEEYCICPYCTDVITSNLSHCELTCEDAEERSSRYYKFSKICDYMIGFAYLSPFLLYILLGKTIFYYEHKMFRMDSSYKFNCIYIYPWIIFMCMYILFSNKNNFTRYLLNLGVRVRTQYTNSIVFTAIKGVIYLFVLLLVLRFEIPFFEKYLWQNTTEYIYFTEQQLQLPEVQEYMRLFPNSYYTETQIQEAAAKLIKEHTMLAIYSCIAYYSAEVIKMCKYVLLKRLNK